MSKIVWFILDGIADILRMIILICGLICVARGFGEFMIDLINWIETIK